MSKILFIKQESYNQPEIDKAITRAFDFFGGVKNFINPGDKVLLKVNMTLQVDGEI